MKIKQILSSIWEEFIYSGHLTSLAAVGVILASSILLNVKMSYDFLCVVYFGAYIIYFFNYYKEAGSDFLTNPQRAELFRKKFKSPFLIIFFLFVLIIGLPLYFNKVSGLFFVLISLLLGLLYTLFFKKLTKRIIGFKSFFIPLMWALLPVFLVVYYSSSFNLALFLVVIFVYLRLFISTNFFDIKDIESDRREGLLTLAILFDKNKLFNILSLINVVTFVPILIGVYLKLFPTSSLMLVLVIFYTFYYFKKSKSGIVNLAHFSYVATDTEKILWPALILFGKILL